MSKKIFLHLLVLCAIWSQGIIGTLADEKIKKSSDVLDRQKRVVSYVPGEDIPLTISNAPYVVYIKQDQRFRCTGTVLSFYVAITAASCVSMDPHHYKVVPGSARSTHVSQLLNVTEIRRRLGDPYTRLMDGVALLIVNPRFPYNVYVQPIAGIYSGPLRIGAIGKVHGWGFNFRSDNRGTDYPINLRSIEVPLISLGECETRYRPQIEITERHVCTYDSRRHCGHNDFGAGLIVQGSLAGVFLWSGLNNLTDPRYPDVFASLREPYYYRWIRSNVDSINEHFQNLHHHR